MVTTITQFELSPLRYFSLRFPLLLLAMLLLLLLLLQQGIAIGFFFAFFPEKNYQRLSYSFTSGWTESGCRNRCFGRIRKKTNCGQLLLGRHDFVGAASLCIFIERKIQIPRRSRRIWNICFASFLPSFILVDFVVVGVFFSQLFLFLLLLLPRNCSVVYFRSEFVSFVIPWNGMANVHNSGRPQRECCHWEGLRPPTPAHLHTSSAGNSSQKL